MNKSDSVGPVADEKTAIALKLNGMRRKGQPFPSVIGVGYGTWDMTLGITLLLRRLLLGGARRG